MNRLRETLSQTWLGIQGSLFPCLAEELGPLTQKQQDLVATLEQVRIEELIPSGRGFRGRPADDRAAVARAFVAKAVYQMPTTRALLDRLATDISLRRICGWERKRDVPDEWTFSRAFAEFSASRLPERVHAALVDVNPRRGKPSLRPRQGGSNCWATPRRRRCATRVPDVPTKEEHRSRWMRFVPQRILRSFFR